MKSAINDILNIPLGKVNSSGIALGN